MWVQSSGTPTQQPLSWRGWRRRPWVRLLSGATLQPSTADAGAESWIASLRATRVSHSALPAGDSENMTSGTCGPTSEGSSRSASRPSFALRTSQDTFAWGLEPSSETLPRWGSMRSGVWYPRQPPARLTVESASLCWPTAVTTDARSSGRHSTQTGVMHPGTTLTDSARLWPTPTAACPNDHEAPEVWRARQQRERAKGQNGNGMGVPLSIAAKEAGAWPGNEMLRRAESWATPCARDGKGATMFDSGHRRGPGLPDQATALDGPRSSSEPRTLSPLFVEWLMGLPLGWSIARIACESSVTRSSPRKRRSRSASSRGGRSGD